MDPQIALVAEQHGLQIPSLHKAADDTAESLAGLQSALTAELDAGVYSSVGIIVAGSLARSEKTADSDSDCLILINGPIEQFDIREMLSLLNQALEEATLKPPGSQGIFGDFTSTSELVGRIGLDSDSNTNTTRRVLLLTESRSIYGAAVRDSVMDLTLRRYCDDSNPQHRSTANPRNVPRFLLNDVVRYWRTVAVDFGAKQWRPTSAGGGWQLRRAKLITTRKILFAGTLMALFLAHKKLEDEALVGQDAYENLIKFLRSEFDRSPLARLMDAYLYCQENFLICN